MTLTRRQQTWLLLTALTILVLGLYGQTWGFGFINFDDPAIVFRNAHVRSGLSWGNLRWAFTSLEVCNWHPLTWLSHQADVSFFGLRPGPMHLANAFFHLAGTILLFQALRKLTDSVYRSALVAALFAVHPLHVESVAWISERKDVLSTCLWMGTLLAYTSYVRRPGLLRYGLTLLVFTLGLMTKPMLVTLPIVLLLLDVWPLRRLEIASLDWRAWRTRILEKLPFMALSLASAGVTLMAQQGAMSRLDEIPFPLRVLWASLATVKYLFFMIWPRGLAFFYPYPSFQASIAPGVAALLLLLLATWLLFSLRARFPYLLIGWGWYLATLLPVIGLVQVGAQAMADRYTYVPLIGPFFAIVWGAQEWARRAALSQRQQAISATLLILLLCPLTALQIKAWRNDLTLFGHAARVIPNSVLARNLYGNALLRQNRPAEALEEFQATIRIVPHRAMGYYGAGDALNLLGKKAKAMQLYRIGLIQEPGYRLLRYQMALTCMETRDFRQALFHLEILNAGTPAVWRPEDGPSKGQILILLGDASDNVGDAVSATKYYRQAALDPLPAVQTALRVRDLGKRTQTAFLQ